MTKEQATTEAARIAKSDGIRMVVTFNPYAETLDESEKFGYHPLAAVDIFKYEKVVDTIGVEK
jgi:sugar/nucleoside kinase (ribokinase family)